MTNEEALERLRDFNTINLLLGRQDIEALDVAIKALNRTIPQQVELMGDGYDTDGNLVYDYAQCPNCQRAFEETDDSWECGYCPCCGQALKWWGNEEGESTN